MPQVAAPLRLLLPLSQTLVPTAPLLHLSRRLFASSSPSLGRAATLRALAYRAQPGRRHHQPRRGSSTLRKAPKEEMAGAGDKEVAFNRKRAEGMDGRKRGTMELKTRKLNPVNTTCYVQILGTGMDTQDTSPSILLFFDKQRFIFNAGEGLQRFCTEHKIKLSKIDHIFLTRVCSETAGGLPGLVLTLAGIGDEGMSVNIWGPSDLDFLAGAMRSFIPNRAMLHTHSFGAERNVSSSQSKDSVIILDDEVVRISAMFVKPRYCNGTGSLNDTDSKPGDTAIVYACELPEIKGKFDPAKAAALGLKPGPKYRELQLGNSVQSDKFDEMLFPSSGFWSVKPANDVMENDKNTSSEASGSVSAQNLLKFHLRPYAQLGLDNASIPSLFTYKDIVEELVSEIPEVKEVPEQGHPSLQNIGMFGVNGADEAVKNLRCIWISHIHADHHTGLARVLALRCTLKPSVDAFLCENVTGSGTPQLESTMFAPGSRMENYNRKPASPRDTTALANFKEVLQESGLEILYSVPVVHCPQAFGVVFRAMEKVNSAGKATFEDSMKDEAIARNHSTTKEAIEVGTAGGAYRIILTHFSQRYPKIPVIDEVDMEKTCIAFDLMSVNLVDLPVLPKVLPHLKVLFKDELVVEEADDIQEAAVY
nr:unnamed protein product [Digitaria exilis]